MGRNEILAELLWQKNELRSRNHAEENRRRDQAEAAIPGLSEALRDREQIIFGGLRGILDGKYQSVDVPAQMAQMNRRVTGLLTGAGYPADWLDPVYTCPLCRDTGYVGEPIRELCDCVRTQMNERLYQEVGLPGSGEECFERFDESVFPQTMLPGMQVTQRKMMTMIRAKCENWANTWPKCAARDLVLSGKSGLGKTWLLHAMAKRLLDRGHEVLIVSAYRFFELARKNRFSRQDQPDTGMLALMEAPVLMLDDLGTEPVMENVTIVELFNLLNERQRTGLSTVVSTNLNEKELRERYTERVTSRMLDKRTCIFIPFEGQDLRRL